MSGGHFDHEESYLGYIAEKLAQDIEFNDVAYDSARPIDTPYGHQLQPETIQYLKIMVEELGHLKELLREYDLAVSGDTSEQHFLKKARSIFQSGKMKKC